MELVFAGKKFESLQKQIERDNVKFKKLTRKEQRIAIAKDVITMLKLKKISAHSTYMRLNDADEILEKKTEDQYEAVDASVVLHQALDAKQCQVCGIGSLFVAAVCKNDKLPLVDLVDGRESDVRSMEVDYLKKWFDDAELDEIESYYENEDHIYDIADGGTELGGSPIQDEEDNDTRLKMIMENIISNGGHFKPNKGKHQDR